MSAVTPLPQAHEARSTIAACVRAHLGVRRISDSELARMIGTTQSQISRRTNERVPFDVDELGKIADALNLTVIELIQMPTPDTTAPSAKITNRLFATDHTADILPFKKKDVA